jgi:rhamnosyl/mannosyltransferase
MIHAPIVRWPFLAKIWTKIVQKRLFQISDGILVASNEIIQCLPHISTWADKIHIFPYGVEPPVASALSHFSSFTSVIRLLSIGRLVSYKGFDVLIDAVSSLPGEWHLIIAGRGPLASPLRKQIAFHGLSDRITLIEGVDEQMKKELFANCDIYIQPSQTIAEAFGIAIAEAFSYSKPVVATNLPTGTAYLARKGACGAIAEIGSPASLRSALMKLIADPIRAQRAAKGNYHFWKKELSVELYQQRYKKLILRFVDYEIKEQRSAA